MKAHYKHGKCPFDCALTGIQAFGFNQRTLAGNHTKGGGIDES
jgi:hypothetical protein